MSSSPGSTRIVTDEAVAARPESLFHSSAMGWMGRARRAGCCSWGGIGGRVIMMGLEDGDDRAERGRAWRAGLRGGMGMMGIGGSACTVCSYRKATRVSSRKGTRAAGRALLTLANLLGAIAQSGFLLFYFLSVLTWGAAAERSALSTARNGPGTGTAPAVGARDVGGWGICRCLY